MCNIIGVKYSEMDSENAHHSSHDSLEGDIDDQADKTYELPNVEKKNLKVLFLIIFNLKKYFSFLNNKNLKTVRSIKVPMH